MNTVYLGSTSRWSLKKTYVFTGDTSAPAGYNRYRDTVFFWDIDLKKITTTVNNRDVEFYTGNDEREPDTEEYIPQDTRVDAYYMPTVPGQPGYVAGQEGKFVTQYSTGVAAVYPVYGVNADELKFVEARVVNPVRGETEGKVYIEVSGGVGVLTYTVYGTGFNSYGPLDADKKAVLTFVPGTYNIQVQEEVASTSPPQVIRRQVIVLAPQPKRGCTDPNATNYDSDADVDDGTCVFAPPPVKPVFIVPRMNSLRMVKSQVYDNYDNFATINNQLFCETDYLGRFNPGYHQKFVFEDVIVTQFQSNYETHKATLHRNGQSAVVAELPITMKQQNQGLPRDFLGWIAAHNQPGETRIYFNTLNLPVQFVAGDTLFLINADTYNGQYAIQAVNDDNEIGAPYVVITKEYTEIEARKDVTVQTLYDVLPYNVYEFPLGLALRSAGEYYVKLEATHPDRGDIIYRSEVFSLKREHPGTHCIRYRNNDNAYEIVYATGIIHVLRVESETFEEYTKGTRTIHRNPDNTSRKLQSTTQQMFTWRTYKLPTWLHTTLAVAVEHDYVEIDGMEVLCEEGYSKPTFINLYALADSSAEMEVVGFMGIGNGPDEGDIDASGSGFIIVQGGYLKKNLD